MIRTYVRHLDYLMLATVLSISAFGLWIMKNATRGGVGSLYTHQLVYVGIGVAGMLAVAAVPPAIMRRSHTLLYAFVLVTVVMVLVGGTSANGAARWITLPGGFQFQPSEFAKLLVIVGLASVIASRAGVTSPTRLTLLALAYAGLPALLVFKEPDFGTALVLGAVVMGMLFVYGAPWRHFVWMILAAAVALALVFSILPGAGVQVLQSYQVDRITAFLHPNRLDPQGNGYNLENSIRAIGHGGIAGTGVKNATQTLYGYVPENSTDFVFSVVGEERGFIGAAWLIALYALLLWRGIKVITKARSTFGALVAAGVVSMLLFQITINIAMTIGLAPITGIPLPFMSFGGSHTVTNLLAIGVLQAIHVHAQARDDVGRLRPG